MDLVFDDDNARVLRSVHDELVSAMEDDVVAIAHIERHERLATIKSLGQSWENISKLEHGVVGNGIEIMVAVDQAGQTLPDYVEERVERSKGRVLRISHNFAPSLSGACASLPGLPFRACACGCLACALPAPRRPRGHCGALGRRRGSSYRGKPVFTPSPSHWRRRDRLPPLRS